MIPTCSGTNAEQVRQMNPAGPELGSQQSRCAEQQELGCRGRGQAYPLPWDSQAPTAQSHRGNRRGKKS